MVSYPALITPVQSRIRFVAPDALADHQFAAHGSHRGIGKAIDQNLKAFRSQGLAYVGEHKDLIAGLRNSRIKGGTLATPRHAQQLYSSRGKLPYNRIGPVRGTIGNH